MSEVTFVRARSDVTRNRPTHDGRVQAIQQRVRQARTALDAWVRAQRTTMEGDKSTGLKWFTEKTTAKQLWQQYLQMAVIKLSSHRRALVNCFIKFGKNTPRLSRLNRLDMRSARRAATSIHSIFHWKVSTMQRVGCCDRAWMLRLKSTMHFTPLNGITMTVRFTPAPLSTFTSDMHHH